MLLRVAQSASRFPLHIVAIYTSTGARAVKMLILTIWLSLSFTFFPFLQSLFISSQLTSPYFTVPLLSPFLLSQHLLHSYLPLLTSTHLSSLPSSPPLTTSYLFSLLHPTPLLFLPLLSSPPLSSLLFNYLFQSLSASEQDSRALPTTTQSCSCPLTTVSTLKHP